MPHPEHIEPGTYLVEMTFAKKVPESLLLAALARMGWEDVVLDEGSGTSTGALPGMSAVRKVIAAAPVAPRPAPPMPVRPPAPLPAPRPGMSPMLSTPIAMAPRAASLPVPSPPPLGIGPRPPLGGGGPSPLGASRLAVATPQAMGPMRVQPGMTTDAAPHNWGPNPLGGSGPKGILGTQRLKFMTPDVVGPVGPAGLQVPGGTLPPGASPPSQVAPSTDPSGGGGGGSFDGGGGGGGGTSDQGGAASDQGGGAPPEQQYSDPYGTNEGQAYGPQDAQEYPQDPGYSTQQDYADQGGSWDTSSYPYDQGVPPDAYEEMTDYGDPYAPPDDYALDSAADAPYESYRTESTQDAFNAAHAQQYAYDDGGIPYDPNAPQFRTQSMQDVFNAAHPDPQVSGLDAGVDMETYLKALAGLGPVPEPRVAGSADLRAQRTARDEQMLRRWAEWGSPVAAPADGSPVAARYRFLGKLTRPLRLVDAPGRGWLYVRRLSVDPRQTLGFRVAPHPLAPGLTYEVVLVARDKQTPHREEVKSMLARMGFQPMKVSLVQRHVRAPGKPASSLSVWFALVRWLGPPSISLIEDPFYFEQMAEAVPG